MFTAYDPDPGDEDDPQTMNGYNYVGNNPVMMIDPDGNFWQYVAAAGFGAAIGAGKYYIKNRLQGKKSTWKGAGKAALRGAGKGVLLVGVGRVLGFAKKGKYIARAFQTKKPIQNFKQYSRHAIRFVKNPKKIMKNTAGKRLVGIRKARYNSLKGRMFRNSNAIKRAR